MYFNFDHVICNKFEADSSFLYKLRFSFLNHPEHVSKLPPDYLPKSD